MRRGTPKAALVLKPAEKARLVLLAAPATSESSESMRAKIVLLCSEGLENREVASRLGTSAHTVGKWRAQFLMAGIRGLHNAPNRGDRPPTSEDQICEVVATALEPSHAGLPTLSTRHAAKASGLSFRVDEVSRCHQGQHRAVRDAFLSRASVMSRVPAHLQEDCD